MGEVMIRCPTTQKPLGTGIIMSKESFESSQLSNNVAGPCPHCGQLHTWNLEDAWIGEEES